MANQPSTRKSLALDRLRQIYTFVALCLLIFFTPLPAVSAATINVDVDCSLANAIRSANGATQTGAMNSCESGDGGADTISFRRDVALRETLPDIVSEVTLQGNSHILSRAADAGDLRLLHVGGAGILTINDLTLTNGRLSGTTNADAGGAILANAGASLTINSSTLRDNYSAAAGGAVAAQDAVLTIFASEFHNNVASENAGSGAAVFASAESSGAVTIYGSAFRANEAYVGGAIF